LGKAVFLSTPAYGHVNPTLALTAELVSRGEHVVYFATDEFRAAIEHVGAEYRSYGEPPEYDTAALENVFAVAELALQLTLRLMPAVLDKVVSEKPDYVLHDAMAVWGKLTARRLKLPAVATRPYFAVSKRKGTGSHRFNLEIARMFFAGLPSMLRCIPLMRRLRLQYGWTDGFTDIFTNVEPLTLVFTSKYFQPNADAFDERFRFVGPQLALRPELEEFPLGQLEGRRVIYISMGTVFNEALSFYRTCLEAFGGLDCLVVLSVGPKMDIASLGPIPKNIIVRQRVPQLRILEHADLFITHAGMNGATEGLYYGVPLLTIPQGADQLLVACRVVQLGAGVYLNRKKVTPARLRETALRIMADDGIRRRCETVRDSFLACGGHVEAADEVLRFVRQRAH
jgi:MGT family glycosyltransferase